MRVFTGFFSLRHLGLRETPINIFTIFCFIDQTANRSVELTISYSPTSEGPESFKTLKATVLPHFMNISVT